MHICRVATVPFMLHNHLGKQIRATIAAGHQVTLICSDGIEIKDLKAIPNIDVQIIEISRKISPIKDWIALLNLIRIFRQKRFDVVHSVTPKAGLLCAMAGFIANIPTRLHTFTGQPWVEMEGLIKHISITCDRLIGFLNTHCYADSPSQADFLISKKIIHSDKISVIGKGSIAGVDLLRFNVECLNVETNRLKESLNIDSNAKIITFIGRITKDKGIFELLRAFHQARSTFPDLVLLLIGPLEDRIDQWPDDVLKILKTHDSTVIKQIGYARLPEKYLTITDVLCLPSYREGFGGVIIEAAAMKIPSIGSRIVGLTDAIIHNQTGLLVEAKSVEPLFQAINRIFNEKNLLTHLGEQAYQRALSDFDSEQFNQKVVAEYEKYSA